MSDESPEETPETAPPSGGSDSDTAGDRRCSGCGASLTWYSKFCPECGTEQSDTWGDPEPGGYGGGSERTEHDGQQDSGWQQAESGHDGQQNSGGQQAESGGGGPWGDPHRQRRGEQSGYTGGSDRTQTAGPGSSTGLAAVTHLSALFFGLLGPLLVYAVTDDPFVKQNAANATNWQIGFLLYNFGLGFLIFALFFISTGLALLAVLLFPVLLAANLVLSVVATVRATDGEAWEYPLTPNLL